MNIYSIYDCKAGVYGQPFFQKNEAVCERSMKQLANDPNNQMSHNPEDFTCMKIGSWDETTGLITLTDSGKPETAYSLLSFVTNE
tara:strand:+ start:294 stop:548 length:255 start_codon:yes stop_codon:yes gene_type:complete